MKHAVAGPAPLPSSAPTLDLSSFCQYGVSEVLFAQQTPLLSPPAASAAADTAREAAKKKKSKRARQRSGVFESSILHYMPFGCSYSICNHFYTPALGELPAADASTPSATLNRQGHARGGKAEADATTQHGEPQKVSVAVYDPSTQSFRQRPECGFACCRLWPYSCVSSLSCFSSSPIHHPPTSFRFR
jgi:hypothetical protein